MKLLSMLFITMLLAAAVSCNHMHCPNKETFLKSYTEFVDGIESQRIDGNKSWTSEDEVFKDYVDRCYKEYKGAFTMEDKKVFWSKTLKFYYNRYNGDLGKAYDHAKTELSEDFNKDFKEMISNPSGDIFGIAKDIFGKDINKGIDTILDALNDFGEELKKVINESDKK